MITNKEVKTLRNGKNSAEIIAQYIVPYNIHSLSRYKHIDNLLLIDNREIKATLGPIDMSIVAYDMSSLYVVPKYEENRIDLIATKLYGQASLYWVICYANNISDPLDIKAGRVLFIPGLEGLKKFPNPLA